MRISLGRTGTDNISGGRCPEEVCHNGKYEGYFHCGYQRNQSVYGGIQKEGKRTDREKQRGFCCFCGRTYQEPEALGCSGRLSAEKNDIFSHEVRFAFRERPT